MALLISRRQPKTKRQNAQTELGDSKVLNIVENVDGMDVGETVSIIKLLPTKEKKKKKEKGKKKEIYWMHPFLQKYHTKVANVRNIC